MTTLPQNNLHDTIIEACFTSDFETIRKCFKDGYLSVTQKTGFDLFTNMCNHGFLEIAEYLWDNQIDLNYRIDINYNYNEAFIHACSFKKLNTASYLILKHDIEKNPNVKQYLETEMFEIHSQIMDLINTKELHKKLDEEFINHNEKTTKKPKI